MDNRPQSPTGRSMASSAERRQRVVPLSYQIAGSTLNLLSLVHNEWASGFLANLWFNVFTGRPKPWVAEFWAGADQRFEVDVQGEALPVHSWGEGPPVVFMHGWSGSGTQFRQFIPPLVASGLRAITFDAPAHGSNPGRQSDLPRFSRSLQAIAREVGPFHGLVAHSLGAMAATHALHDGLPGGRIVLIAPHLEVQKMFETYSELLNMRPRLAQRFHDKIGERMRDLLDGIDPWTSLTPQRLLTEPTPTGLLIHDHEDPEISTRQFDEMAALWQGAGRYETRGLGHNRILKDDAVINTTIEYLHG